MRASRAIGAYAAAAILGGALLAPWLFWLAQWLAADVPAAAGLGGYAFHRVFDRAVLVTALAGLWPMLRAIGVRSWAGLGLARSPRWWREVLTGLGVGLGSLLSVGLVSLALGARGPDFNHSPALVCSRLLVFALSAVVVALLEEILFRGGIQGALTRAAGLPTALVVASVIYSAVHFLKPSRLEIAAADVRWFSGLTCLSHIVSGSLADPAVLVGFITLSLAGAALGLAFARTQRLYLSMGLHAGWVFTLKAYSFFTMPQREEWPRWLGAGSLTENVLTWPVLAVLVVLLWRWRPGAAGDATPAPPGGC